MSEVKTVKAFLSYSHKDERYKEPLFAQLSPWVRQGLIEFWHDRDIRAGDEWNEAILKHFDDAGAIICLISANFLSSDYIHNVEMQRAFERRKSAGVMIVPVLLKAVNLEMTPFNKLQVIPRDKKPILDYPHYRRDKVFAEVAREIGKVIDMLNANHT